MSRVGVIIEIIRGMALDHVVSRGVVVVLRHLLDGLGLFRQVLEEQDIAR